MHRPGLSAANRLSILGALWALLAIAGCGSSSSPDRDDAEPNSPHSTDYDQDGAPSSVDCDDADPEVGPGWPETCDGKDNNCDGLVDVVVAGVTHPTIQDALDNRCADVPTVLIWPGYYFENIVVSGGPVTVTGIDAPSNTVVDGSTCSNGGDSCSVVTVEGGTELTLGHLTVTGGTGSIRPEPSWCQEASCGGGVLVDHNAALTLSQAVVQENSVTGDGGGVASLDGVISIGSSVIRHNAAGRAGGGLSVLGQAEEGTVVIYNSVVTGNTAVGKGGGLYFHSLVLPLLTSNRINSNRAEEGWGGGVLTTAGGEAWNNSFTGNEALDHGAGLSCVEFLFGGGNDFEGNSPDAPHQGSDANCVVPE